MREKGRGGLEERTVTVSMPDVFSCTHWTIRTSQISIRFHQTQEYLREEDRLAPNRRQYERLQGRERGPRRQTPSRIEEASTAEHLGATGIIEVLIRGGATLGNGTRQMMSFPSSLRRPPLIGYVPHSKQRKEHIPVLTAPRLGLCTLTQSLLSLSVRSFLLPGSGRRRWRRNASGSRGCSPALGYLWIT